MSAPMPTGTRPAGYGPGSVLVAGVGNLFLGDDGFGVEVAHRLAERELPPGTVVADYGIRGLHLAYDLLDGDFSTLILIDAVPVDEPPGTVVVLELHPGAADSDDAYAPSSDLPSPADLPPDVPSAIIPPPAAPDAHGMDPATVLNLLRTLGGLGPGPVERVYLVGVRPARLDEEMGLSAPVAAALDPAADAVLELLDLLGSGGTAADDDPYAVDDEAEYADVSDTAVPADALETASADHAPAQHAPAQHTPAEHAHAAVPAASGRPDV
ncbi:hydrogenase maturation protease [Actinospica durhamensis]|uniref:Hydrogenase maturation protease n=1 Tax=Actinospica durhamensis TaxID=1508375 RepID=A0A941IUD8_9ACTN|nr:hydrogenase maturation protease [Actinospica durhamensis]MBR7838947.1 hydrogenase maturation protease [Actinospica durhamensis]